MAEVRLENGYSPVANSLLEAIYRCDFTATEYRVLFAIIRYTYGYSRKNAELSVSFLSGVTQTPKRSVERALAGLIGSGVVSSVPGGSRKDSKLLGVNKNYSEWVKKGLLKECSNGVEIVSKTQITDKNDGSYKKTTTDKNDGSLQTTTDSGDGRTTDSGDGHIKQVKQILTTITTTSPPYNPPTGEKTEKNALPGVENFSGPYLGIDQWDSEILTDKLSGLTFNRKKWNELEEALGTQRLLDYYDRLRDGYLHKGWKFKTDILNIIERWYRKDSEND